MISIFGGSRPMAHRIRADEPRVRPMRPPAHAADSPNSPTTLGTRPLTSPRVAGGVWRVWAVVPCFNRARDAQRLLEDLARQRGSDADPGSRYSLDVVLIDNASSPPLADQLVWPDSLRAEIVRLDANLGGAGGFNEGLRHAIRAGRAGDPLAALWLLDSDARLAPDALAALVRVLAKNPSLAAVGSVLADPETREIFEAGGRVDPRTGEYVQPEPRPRADGTWPEVIQAQYLAACSLLVRRSAVERAGLMPDVFLNGDDVAWCLDLRRRTGMDLGAVPGSVAYHSRPDRMRTGARYYAARNAFDAIDRLGLGARARAARAAREVGRAVGQTLIGRDDLARLHLRGLADAIARRSGPAPDGAIEFEPWRPWEELDQTLAQATGVTDAGERGGGKPDAKRELDFVDAMGLVGRRLLSGPEREVARVTARGRDPREWLAARTLVIADESGFVIRQIKPGERATRLASVLLQGAALTARLAIRPPRPARIVPATAAYGGDVAGAVLTDLATPSLSVVVLSYNRVGALEETLRHLRAHEPTKDAEITVVDNASEDGSAVMVEREFRDVRLTRLDENLGVEGFNRGALEASGDVLLVLDDDARPDPAGLANALHAMARDPSIGAIPLHPRHPATGKSEWSFAGPASVTDSLPVLGCGNLVRTEAWRMARGYEAGYFLYRNDADLAMSLLDMGWNVRFDPSWVVWHDSPQARHKSLRWHATATRNWLWMCRRHGRGVSGMALAILGWAWAHRLAGLRPRAHWRTLRGAWQGLMKEPPARPGACQSTGWPVRRLLALRLFGRA